MFTYVITIDCVHLHLHCDLHGLIAKYKSVRKAKKRTNRDIEKVRSMEDYIKDIIEKAKEQKGKGISDIDIARFVHVELGKVIYYDNNYTEKRLDGKNKTELSTIRQNSMLKADTDKSSKNQICKGMAEIYTEILNEIGIEARTIGVKAKGETAEVDPDEAEHYCTIL